MGYQGPPPPAPPPPTYGSHHGAPMPPMPPMPQMPQMPQMPPGPPGPPGPPPPPVSYPPPFHPPGFDAPAPYANSFPPPPPNQGWQHDLNGHNNQRHKDRRDRRNDRDRGPKNRNNRRDNENQRGRGQRHEAPGPRSLSTSRQPTPRPGVTVKDEKTEVSKTASPAPAKDDKDDKGDKEHQLDQDFLWDMEKAFVELKPKDADEVGIPLAAEWNDNPTIPPAYNAKCIKSAFYDPNNPDAFLASVRDTKYWSDLKRDPVFRYRRGMVAVQFSGSQHEYFTYRCSRKLGPEWFKEREFVPTPSDASLNDAMKPRNTYQAHMTQRLADSPLLSNGKRSYQDSDDYRRDPKRARASTGRDRSPPPRHLLRPSSRGVDVDGDSWAPGETRVDSPRRPYSRDEFSHSPGGYRLQHGDRLAPYNSAQNHDSGYHSAHSAEKYRSQREDKNLGHRLSPPPSVRVRERDSSRDRDRDWDRGYGRDRDRERERGRSPSYTKPRSRTRSRTRSPTPAAADSDEDSGMSDLEYELLGLERPKKKAAPTKPLMKKPRVRVNDAFR